MRIAEINQLKAMGYDEKFIRSCVKSVKGTIFSIPASGNLEGSFQLPGTSKILLGFRLSVATASTSSRFTVYLNQEKIFDSVEALMLDCQTSAIRDEYIESFRHMVGQDILNVVFSNASAATDVNVMAYYLLQKTQ